MIESLLNPSKVEKFPWEAFIAGFIFTFVACFLTLQIGTSSPCNTGLGLLLVGFISIAATPLFVNIFRIESKKKKGNILQRHWQVIEIYAFFFVGVVFASSLFFIMLPPTTANYLFSDQSHDLTAREIVPSGSATTSIGLSDIVVNNFRVLFLSFVFSFVLGAGAVFIITWNATILGVLIGKIAGNPVMFGSIELVQGNAAANYIVALPFTLIRLLPHGIFEFGGYFLGAIAGGILSVAIIQEKFKKDWREVLQDSGVYLALAALCILIGAVIEVVV
jgi:uncharacterized membrane protein SpoIIM required for sporulation